jgi:hypothetical protein
LLARPSLSALTNPLRFDHLRTAAMAMQPSPVVEDR